jgi:hypothetical protein
MKEKLSEISLEGRRNCSRNGTKTCGDYEQWDTHKSCLCVDFFPLQYFIFSSISSKAKGFLNLFLRLSLTDSTAPWTVAREMILTAVL